MAVNEITLTLRGSLELLLRPPPPEILCFVTTYYEGFISAAKGSDMAYTLPGDKMVTVHVDYVDAQGRPAQVDGEVTWDTSSPDVASIEVDDTDSQTCRIFAGNILGTTQVSAHADADLGSGTMPLVTILDVTVVAGTAVAGTISPVGDPEPIP